MGKEKTGDLKLVLAPDPILTLACKPVEKWDDDLYDIIDRMVLVMKKHNGIGIAAPQVGLSIQILVAYIPTKMAEPLHLINPKILWKSEESNFEEEGCLSYPGVFVPVQRPDRIMVRSLGPPGSGLMEDGFLDVSLEFKLARCVQHEMDHLEGICLIDHISSLPRRDRQRILKELKKMRK